MDATTRRTATVGAVALAAFAMLGCKDKPKAEGAAPAVVAPPAAAPPAARTGGQLRIALSVDWEGAYLSDEGLDAIEDVGRALPGVPLTHFVCPAYLTRGTPKGVGKAAAIEAIRTALRPGDQLGLHIHAWRSLVEAAGVGYRSTPSFLKPELMAFDDGDQGFEVELAAYRPEEIGKLVASSKKLLTAAGFEVAPAFRTGGYVSTPEVLAALRAQGFEIDSSSTDAAYLADDLGDTALPARIGAIWPGLDAGSQPFVVATPKGPILEMPAYLTDYLTETELLERLRAVRAAVAADPGRDRFVGVVFHQETGGEYAPAVVAALTALKAEPGPPIVFETVTASAAAARAQLPPGPAR